MDITKIMGIGIGRAGNVLLDEFLQKDARLTGLFVNSAYVDTEGLKKFDKDKNAYIFAGTSGSGRDRNNAKDFLGDYFQALADRVDRYPNQDVVYVFFSLDGGTGSGITPKFLQVLHRTCPDKKINVVGVLPDFETSDYISLNNTIECWNELAKVLDMGNVVDSVLFIDNHKRKNFTSINKKAIDDIYNSFIMNGKSEHGTLDDGDAKRTLTAKGYGFILTLEDKYKNISEAVNEAVKDSVFAKPNQYVCDYLCISLNNYDLGEGRDIFEFEQTAYLANNDKGVNVIALGGCDEPSEAIETIKLAHDDLKSKQSKRNRNKRTIIEMDNGIEADTKTKGDTKNNNKQHSKRSASDLDDLFADLF